MSYELTTIARMNVVRIRGEFIAYVQLVYSYYTAALAIRGAARHKPALPLHTSLVWASTEPDFENFAHSFRFSFAKYICVRGVFGLPSSNSPSYQKKNPN